MTSTRRLEIRVDQTGDAAKGIKGVAGSIAKLEKAANKAVGKIAKLGTATNKAATKGLSKLGRTATATAKSTVKLDQGAEKAIEGLAGLDQGAEKAIGGVAKLGKVAITATKGIAKLAGKAAVKGIVLLGKAVIKTTKVIVKLGLAAGKAAIKGVAKLGTAAYKTVKGVAKLGLAAGKAAIGGIGLLVGAALGLGAKLSSLGADAAEMQGKFDVVFGEGAPEAARELDEFGNAVGRNKFALMEMASSIQDTFVPMGFARDKAADMAIEMTKLAVDVGSFNNVLAPDVMLDFQSALIGNHETVLKYGIIINEATLKAKAFEMGLIDVTVSSEDVEAATGKLALASDKASLAQRKHTSVLAEHGKGSAQAQASAIRLTSANMGLKTAEDRLAGALAGEAGAMDDTAKVLARKQIIIDGTTDAQGDAIKTSESWTNQMLALKEAVTEGATEMGLFLNEALLPLLGEFVPWVKDLMPEAVEIFKKFAAKLSETVGPVLIVIKDAVMRIAEAFGVQTEDVSSADVVLKALEKTLGAIVTALELTALAFQAVASAVEIAVDLWGNLKPILESAWITLKQIAAISFSKLIGYWDKMKDAARRAINAIPDWLRPGSPTPFEVGLKGISQAAKDIDLSMGMGGTGKGDDRKPMTALAKAGQTIILNLTYAPAVSLADRYEAQEKLTPFILGALRTAGVTL